MKTRNANIVITDWAGNELYRGPYDAPEVDVVLAANRCKKCTEDTREDCPYCTDSGYSGDFEVEWEDENETENVFEYINY